MVPSNSTSNTQDMSMSDGTTASSPMVLFHAVRDAATFTRFYPDKNGLRFFAEDCAFAEYWLGDAYYAGGFIVKVQVHAPRIWNFDNEQDMVRLLWEMEKRGIDVPSGAQTTMRQGDWLTLEYEVPAILEELGYDGFWVMEEDPTHLGCLFRNLAVFSTASVRLAIGNKELIVPFSTGSLSNDTSLSLSLS